MALTRRSFLAASAAASLGALVSGCGRPAPAPSEDGSSPEASVDLHAYDSLALDRSAWRRDEEHDVYYQLCVPYCLKPASSTVQRLSVFVPGAYFDAEADGDGFSCTVAPDAHQGSYDVAGAPVVMAVGSSLWRGQAPATTYAYEGLAPYMEAGCVYVLAGCRGRTTGYESRGAHGSDEGTVPGGLPWNVTDLKSAIRFLRYNGSALPGAAANVFCLGAGAGAGLCACLGATGDAAGFDPYLDAEGAARWDAEGTGLSDRPTGCVLWDPPVSLAAMDGAYEWLYGRHDESGTRAQDQWTGALSRDLAGAYGQWLGPLGLTDGDHAPLALSETPDGQASDGSYLQAVLGELEASAERFFDGTAFPCEVERGRAVEPSFPGVQASPSEASEELVEGAAQNAEAVASAGLEVDLGAAAAVRPEEAPAVQAFQTARDYVDSLNGSGEPWLSYSVSRGTVRIGSVAGYVRALAAPELACTAYDGLACDTPENQLLGVPDDQTLHYSQMVYDLLNHNQWSYDGLAGWKSAYVGDWAQNLWVRDSCGLTPPKRCALCSPLAYVAPGGERLGAGEVAPAWRVNVGLAQSQVPFTEAMNLVWALKAYDGVEAVDFTAVWEGGFGLCEESGDPVANALAWVAGHCPHAKDASKADGS